MQPAGYSGAAFTGKALAGTQPLIGASLQLYSAGTAGNGSVPTALLSSAAVTDSSGAFSIPAGYSCSSASALLYLVATGGKPGANAASANSAITFLTAVGPCSQIATSPPYVVNEATTVAAAYALAPFLAAGAKIGASSSNTTGLQNAFATAAALTGPQIGASPGPTFSANGTSPAATVNTLANLLNACASANSTSSACTSLFSNATPSGGAAPTNTLDAALNLARNPTANLSALYALAGTSSAYTPTLTTAPADWTIYIDYSGGGLSSPTGVALDSSGNVWVANNAKAASLFSPLGKPLFSHGVTGFGLNASFGLAVDSSNHAWIPNEPGSGVAGNSITVVDSTGGSLSGSGGYTFGGLDYPIAVAIDTDSSAWIVDYGNSHLTHLSSSGQPVSGSAGYSSSQLAFPVAIALDASHYVWVPNQGGTTITRISPDGSQFTSYNCCSSPSNLAIDQSGNVWATNFYSSALSEVSSTGTVLANATISGGGLDYPQGIAIDGAGTVWIANYRSSHLSKFSGAGSASPGTALSPATGLGAHPALAESYAIAVDASGNLWVTNYGSNTLTEFIGLAAPVRTPQIGPPAAP